MGLIKLAINRQTKALVDFGGSATAIPRLFQGDTQDFIFIIVDPPSSVGSPYTRVDVGSLNLRVSIGATPTGTAGGPTPLTLDTTWTWDSSLKQFTGSLALNTAAIAAHIGALDSASARFEVKLDNAGALDTILHETFNLAAPVDENTTTAPSPTTEYFSAAQSDNRYVKKIGEAGGTILLVSPDGTKGIEIGCNNDGTFSVIPVTI
jgi:hypothetical protein